MVDYPGHLWLSGELGQVRVQGGRATFRCVGRAAGRVSRVGQTTGPRISFSLQSYPATPAPGHINQDFSKVQTEYKTEMAYLSKCKYVGFASGRPFIDFILEQLLKSLSRQALMSRQVVLQCTFLSWLGLADRGVSILLFTVCSRISRLFVFEE